MEERSVCFRKKTVLHVFKFSKVKNFFLADFENVKKKRFEKSIQSNLVKVSFFKVHFSTFAKVFEKYLFSLAFYGKFAINQTKNLSEKNQSFCWIFLIFFQLIVNIGQKLFSRVVQTRIKVYIGTFWKKVFLQRTKFFLNLSSNFQKKSGIFSHIFWNGCRNCFLRVQKIALIGKTFFDELF